MINRMAVTLTTVLVFATSTGAQVRAPASLDRSRVRIQVAGRPMEEGRIVGITADTLHYTLTSDSRRVRSIAIGDAEKILVGSKSTRLGRISKFATIGLLGGAAAGYAIGARGYHAPVTERQTWDTWLFGPITVDQCVEHCNEVTPASRGLKGALIGGAAGIVFSQLWDGPWKVLRFR